MSGCTSGELMQTINVLGNHPTHRGELLKFGNCYVPRIRLGLGKILIQLDLSAPILLTFGWIIYKFLDGDGCEAVPQTALAAVIADTAVSGYTCSREEA